MTLRRGDPPRGGLGAVEETLHRMFEQAPLAIVAFDLDGRIMAWNPGAQRVLGWSADEVIGRFPPHVPSENVAEFQANHRATLEQGGLTDLTVRRRHRDGHELWLHIANSVLQDDQGSTIGYLSMIRDITAECETRHALVEAEARYRTLVERMPMVAFLAPLSVDEPVIYSGPGYGALLGLADHQVPGTIPGFVALLHPDDRAGFLAAKERVRAQDEPVEFEYRILRPDGRPCWLQERIVRVLDENGVPVAVQGFVVDVTGRRNAEERAAIDRDRLSVVLDSVGEGIFAVDSAGAVVLANRAFHRISGLDEPALRGRAAAELLVHRATPRTLVPGDPFDCLEAHTGTAAHALLLRHADGHLVPVTCTVSPLAGPGVPSGVAVVVRDVSEVVALESQLHHAQRVEAVGRLAGGIAHDFNNLLTVIQGHLALALQRLGDDGDLLQVQRAAERAAGLTQQLLAYGRRQVLQPVPTDINRVVGEMRAMLERLLGADVDLTVEAAESLPAVLVDAGRLEQVIVNLAVNARDAMPDGGALVFRTRRLDAGSPELPRPLASTSSSWVELTVADSGTGIDPELVDLIFEPFFTTKERGRGSGLGLSTVYGIVTQSGGDISVRSTPGQGAAFTILLPALAADVQAVRPGPAAAPAAAAPAGLAGSVPGGTAVLLVEDDPSVRLLLARTLQGAGYRVLQAGSAPEAILVAEVERLDALVTDIVLPGARGTEVLAQVRRSAPNLPAVLISGYDESALASGVPDHAVFLQKPFLPRDLAATLAALLERTAAGRLAAAPGS